MHFGFERPSCCWLVFGHTRHRLRFPDPVAFDAKNIASATGEGSVSQKMQLNVVFGCKVANGPIICSIECCSRGPDVSNSILCDSLLARDSGDKSVVFIEFFVLLLVGSPTPTSPLALGPRVSTDAAFLGVLRTPNAWANASLRDAKS